VHKNLVYSFIPICFLKGFAHVIRWVSADIFFLKNMEIYLKIKIGYFLKG